MKPVIALTRVAGLRFHGHAKRLDQPSVLNAGRTRRLTRPTIEAEFQVLPNRVVQVEATIGHAPHQVDAAPRAVVFVTQLGIGRTGGGTQSAMDTIEKQLIVDGGARIRVHWATQARLPAMQRANREPLRVLARISTAVRLSLANSVASGRTNNLLQNLTQNVKAYFRAAERIQIRPGLSSPCGSNAHLTAPISIAASPRLPQAA